MTEKIIGSVAEQKQIRDCFESDKAELVSVFGRRRVGKTFLIKQCFNEEFDFWFTGMYQMGRSQQLTQFRHALCERAGEKTAKIKDWFEAFDLLKKYLLSLGRGRVVVFLDELRWMDTPQGKFPLGILVLLEHVAVEQDPAEALRLRLGNDLDDKELRWRQGRSLRTSHVFNFSSGPSSMIRNPTGR